MKYTLLIMILSAVMAFLSGCTVAPVKCANPVIKCEKPEYVDSKGGCSARWM